MLFKDIACEVVEACVAPAQARHPVDRSWRKRLEGRVDDGWDVLEARAMNDAEPINPQRVFWELSPRLPDRCIPTADSGSATNGYGTYAWDSTTSAASGPDRAEAT